MSKEMLKNSIELVPEKDIDTLYRVVVKFVPEVIPEPEEFGSFKRRTGGQSSERDNITRSYKLGLRNTKKK